MKISVLSLAVIAIAIYIYILISSNNNLLQEVDALQKDNSKNVKMHEELMTEFEILEDDKKSVEDKSKQLDSQVKELDSQVNDLDSDIKSLELHKKKLESHNKKLKSSVDSLNNKTKELKTEKETLLQKLSLKQERAKQKAEAIEQARQRDIAIAKENEQKLQTLSVKTVTPQVSKAQVSPAIKQAQPKARQSTTSRVVQGQVTAYTANCKGCTGITASGKTVSNGMVAAAPHIPFGTRVRITVEGYGSNVYTVEDRGSAIQGNKIDIFMPSHAEAVKFGRRNAKIEILN